MPRYLAQAVTSPVYSRCIESHGDRDSALFRLPEEGGKQTSQPEKKEKKGTGIARKITRSRGFVGRFNREAARTSATTAMEMFCSRCIIVIKIAGRTSFVRVGSFCTLSADELWKMTVFRRIALTCARERARE